MARTAISLVKKKPKRKRKPNSSITNIYTTLCTHKTPNKFLRGGEFDIQKSFFRWLSFYPSIREVSFSVPNDGASRTAKETMFLKMTGLTPGAPDVLIMYPVAPYHGLVIEFKTQTGSLSDVQRKMLNSLSLRGYDVNVCRSLDEGIDTVKEYFGTSWNQI